MLIIEKNSLGDVWIALLQSIFRWGEDVAEETLELVGVHVSFCEACNDDPILIRYADAEHIEQMHKVFFSFESNLFGHSYHKLCKGPAGKNDLSDVIELLNREPTSKRALISLTGEGNGKVPCINAIHFLLRNEGLEVIYFSRGQDIYRKFYADSLCIFEMAKRVANGLNRPIARVTGFISSAHIYKDNLREIADILDDFPQAQSESVYLSETTA